MVLEEPPAPAERVEVGRAAAGARRLFSFWRSGIVGRESSSKGISGVEVHYLDNAGQGWMRGITARYRL